MGEGTIGGGRDAARDAVSDARGLGAGCGRASGSRRSGPKGSDCGLQSIQRDEKSTTQSSKPKNRGQFGAGVKDPRIAARRGNEVKAKRQAELDAIKRQRDVEWLQEYKELGLEPKYDKKGRLLHPSFVQNSGKASHLDGHRNTTGLRTLESDFRFLLSRRLNSRMLDDLFQLAGVSDGERKKFIAEYGSAANLQLYIAARIIANAVKKEKIDWLRELIDRVAPKPRRVEISGREGRPIETRSIAEGMPETEAAEVYKRLLDDPGPDTDGPEHVH